jgi:hypothetical protein
VIGGERLATIPSNRQVHAKLEVARPDGTTWVDVTDYLVSAEVELGSIEELGTGTGADIGVRTLTFELKNNGANIYFWLIADIVGDSEDAIGSDIDAIGGSQDDVLPWLSTLLGEPKWGRNSFAPRDKMSDWNNHGGTWSPLLWPYRPVSLSVAVTSPGVAPTQWARLFEGYLGDNIATDHHAVSVSCRDKSKRLMDAYIDVKKTYTGPISAEALIQAIINDYVTSPPTLYCPVASGITFDEMTVEYVSVWDAIKNVAAQMGWFLGYRWNGSSFALTFLEPPRGKTTADFHFDWEDEIYTETLDINDADIRNALTITYNDKTTQRRETLRYTDFAQLRNDESKDEYGGLYRIMQVEEADTSLIDTQVKALSFGEKCIWDLSELSATDKLNLPLLPELDLFSTFTVTNPLISSTTDFFAVQSIRHSLRFGENARFRTEVIATGRVVGAKSKWLDMETRPGRPGKPIDGDRVLSDKWDEAVTDANQALIDAANAQAAIALAQQTYQKLLDHHFFGDEEGYFDGAGIKPSTVETQHLAVGAGTRNFELVGVKMDANTGDVRGRFSNTSGYLILATDVGEDAKVWNISAKTQQQTIGQQLYVYARCSKTTTAGEIMFSTTRPALQDSSYHYFLIGMYFTTDNPAVLAVSYGFTYINGAHITTGVIDCNVVNIEATGTDGKITITGQGIVARGHNLVKNFEVSTTTGNVFTRGHVIGAVYGE